MADFQFLEDQLSKRWIILAPRRAKRPDVARGPEPICPFCPGKETQEEELYRVPPDSSASDWLVRVLPNKFPFAPVHEVIIHSQDHHKNFGELPVDHVELILQTYRQRYQTHQSKGQVVIFHNRGEAGGESLPHPHTQLTVVPQEVHLDIPRLSPDIAHAQDIQETEHFAVTCPQTSQWPDEVWVAPRSRGRSFGEITDDEISDLAGTVSRIIEILDLRHGHDFPFNFYIYPAGDWYMRITPRAKTLGGFEISTGIFVNTQDPAETMSFIKEHFVEPNKEKIRSEHQAEYSKHV